MLRNRKGFTLIELLIVVVIIGILAAIALPKFGQTRERAYLSAMQSDLRNLQTAQEMYYNGARIEGDETPDYTYWTGDEMEPQQHNEQLDFTPSSGVYVLVAPAGGSANVGWTATARHEALPDGPTCVVTIGGAGSSGIDCN